MKLIIVAKSLTPLDPKLQEAARLVIDNQRTIKEIADVYHFNPETLGEEVENVRKERTLPTEEILGLRSDPRPFIRVPKAIAKKLNIPVLDVVWYLRRALPDTKVELVPEEEEEIIRLKEMGLSNRDIANKMMILPLVIINTLHRKGREDLIRGFTSEETAGSIYKDYQNMIAGGKTHNDVIKGLVSQYDINEHTVRKILRDRDIKVRDRGEVLSEDKKKEILEMVKSGISLEDIAKVYNIHSVTVRKIVKALDPEFYEENFSRKEVPEEVAFFIVDNFKKYTANQIIQMVKERYDYDLTLYQFHAVKNARNLSKRQNLQNLQNFPINEVTQNEVPQEKDIKEPNFFGDLEQFIPVGAEGQQNDQAKKLTNFFSDLKPTPKKVKANIINWYRQARQARLDKLNPNIENQVPYDAIMEIVGNGHNTGWLSPTGEYYSLEPYDSHEDFMKRIYSGVAENSDTYREFKKDYEKGMISFSFTEFGYENGWVRIVFYDYPPIIEAMGSPKGLSSEHLQRLKEATGLRLEAVPVSKEVYAGVELGIKVGSGSGGNIVSIDEMSEKINKDSMFIGWLSPTGDIYDLGNVTDANHKDFIKSKFAKEIALEEKNAPRGMSIDIYAFAFKRGWVRIFYRRNYDAIYAEGTSEGAGYNYSKLKQIEEVTGKKVEMELAKMSFASAKTFKTAKTKNSYGQIVTEDELYDDIINHGSEYIYGWGGWLSPDGKIHKVEAMEHMRYIKSILGKEMAVEEKLKQEMIVEERNKIQGKGKKQNNLEYKDKDKYRYEINPYTFAYSLGWVRIYILINKTGKVDVLDAIGSDKGIANRKMQLNSLAKMLNARLEVNINTLDLGYYLIANGVNWYKTANIGERPIPYNEILGHRTGDFVYGWLNPNGDFYQVDFSYHGPFMENYYRNDKDYLKEKAKRDVDILMYAYAKGWVRIGIVIADSRDWSYIDAMGTAEALASENLRRLGDAVGYKLDKSVLTNPDLAVYAYVNNWYKTAQVVKAVPYDEIANLFQSKDYRSLSGQIFGWLTPDGNFYNVPFEKHAQFIHEFLRGESDYKNAEKEAKKKNKFFSPTSYAFKAGWIRIGINFMGDKLVDAEGTPAALSSENLRRLKEVLGFRLELSYRNVG